jgi:hypothetical protein
LCDSDVTFVTKNKIQSFWNYIDLKVLVVLNSNYSNF